jgi:diphthamide synthase (EF-2-diphthine--ammonia ligase)
MRGVFPLWKSDTTQLIQRFIRSGYKAYLSCVEGKLGEPFAGRAIDADLVADLPDGIDPCGEYGEFHSFVFDGPIFSKPIDVVVGEVVCRDTRFYAELLPANSKPAATEIPAVGSV